MTISNYYLLLHKLIKEKRKTSVIFIFQNIVAIINKCLYKIIYNTSLYKIIYIRRMHMLFLKLRPFSLALFFKIKYVDHKVHIYISARVYLIMLVFLFINVCFLFWYIYLDLFLKTIRVLIRIYLSTDSEFLIQNVKALIT